MAPYEYSALDEEASEIRLMTLLPGRFGDDVLITLETVTLTKEHTPQYEALSYAWGSKEKSKAISVKARITEGSKSLSLLGRSRQRRLEARNHRTIYVTEDLATALPHLRKENMPRVFWIDAICVNQQDIAERGHQVKRMAAVFSMASRVIVWLGPESQNSTLALRGIDRLGSQLRVDWATRYITLVSAGEIITRFVDPFDDGTWKSVGDLLNRPWFDRLWIWQEVRLAREAYLLCGNEGVPWESVRKVILHLQQSTYVPERIVHLVHRCFRISGYRGHEYSDLKGVLSSARSASCSDPRDKIFAVLSLAHESQTRGIDVDYSKPAEAIFRDLVLHFTSNLQTLDILRHCELRDDTGGMKLPTWVPNWTVPRLSKPILISAPCENSKPRVRQQDGRILVATGVHSAVIKCVESLPRPIGPAEIFSIKEIENGIRALIVPKIKFESVSERNAIVNSLCRTLFCNHFDDRASRLPLRSVTFEVGREYMHRIINTTQDSPLDDSYEESGAFFPSVASKISGRSFFTTDDGYIGLAPIATKPNDEVCILLGCRSPLVLRPCGDGYHKVVGDCYIDGLMDGAALLGPLPSNWQLVRRYFEEHSIHYNVFLDHQTGEFQPEDPRLGPLPAGWYITDHKEKNACNLYANDETGERTWFDPRMTPEALTARGVEMREFQLV